MTLNARADTIFEKPPFREPIMKKRCIVPSTGYFEWRHEGANKIPYYIYLKDEPISPPARPPEGGSPPTGSITRSVLPTAAEVTSSSTASTVRLFRESRTKSLRQWTVRQSPSTVPEAMLRKTRWFTGRRP